MTDTPTVTITVPADAGPVLPIWSEPWEISCYCDNDSVKHVNDMGYENCELCSPSGTRSVRLAGWVGLDAVEISYDREMWFCYVLEHMEETCLETIHDVHKSLHDYIVDQYIAAGWRPATGQGFLKVVPV